MSDPIAIRQFARWFSLYAAISLVIHLALGFTIVAGIVYLVTLLPFYLLCVAHVVSLATQHWHHWLRYRTWGVVSVAIAQLLVLVSSPSNCYGVKQGTPCTSLLQTLLTGDSSSGWGMMFAIALALYAIAVVAFLSLICIGPPSPRETL